MKKIMLQCGKKLPIPDVPYSNIEASAYIEVEVPDDGDFQKKREEAKGDLYNLLADSAMIVEESDIIPIAKRFKEIEQRMFIVVEFLKERKLFDEFKSYYEDNK